MTFTSNTSQGIIGGVSVFDGQTVVITDSIISGNTATGGSGGGLQVGPGATVSITDSTISDNIASGPGGGIVVRSGG